MATYDQICKTRGTWYATWPSGGTDYFDTDGRGGYWCFTGTSHRFFHLSTPETTMHRIYPEFANAKICTISPLLGVFVGVKPIESE